MSRKIGIDKGIFSARRFKGLRPEAKLLYFGLAMIADSESFVVDLKHNDLDDISYYIFRHDTKVKICEKHTIWKLLKELDHAGVIELEPGWILVYPTEDLVEDVV